MKRTFKTVDYVQALDLTVRLGDCLPPNHLACFVVASVANLDLSVLYARYGTRGGEPYASCTGASSQPHHYRPWFYSPFKQSIRAS